eukprot:5127269-Amphidinium_carterae.1
MKALALATVAVAGLLQGFALYACSAFGTHCKHGQSHHHQTQETPEQLIVTPRTPQKPPKPQIQFRLP